MKFVQSDTPSTVQIIFDIFDFQLKRENALLQSIIDSQKTSIFELPINRCADCWHLYSGSRCFSAFDDHSIPWLLVIFVTSPNDLLSFGFVKRSLLLEERYKYHYTSSMLHISWKLKKFYLCPFSSILPSCAASPESLLWLLITSSYSKSTSKCFWYLGKSIWSPCSFRTPVSVPT